MKVFTMSHVILFSLRPINILLSGPCRAADWCRAGKGTTLSSTVQHQRGLYADGCQGKIEIITLAPDIGFCLKFGLNFDLFTSSWWNMSMPKAWRSITPNHWIRKALSGLPCGTLTTTPLCQTPMTGQVSALPPRTNCDQISLWLLSLFFIFHVTNVWDEVF